MTETKFDIVNKAEHYNSSPATCKNCGHQIECIDVIKHMNFTLGSVVKYVWRAALKGALIQDLEKAAYYLKCEIEKLKKEEQCQKSTSNTKTTPDARLEIPKLQQ